MEDEMYVKFNIKHSMNCDDNLLNSMVLTINDYRHEIDINTYPDNRSIKYRNYLLEKIQNICEMLKIKED